MQFNHTLLGVRIEFYEYSLGVDEQSRRYLGAAVKDAAFVGATIPREGERVSIVSLFGGVAHAAKVRLRGRNSAFIDVAYVEHYPVAINGNEGEPPPWWEPTYRTPSATLVLHSQMTPRAMSRPQFVETLATQGWSLFVAEQSGGEELN